MAKDSQVPVGDGKLPIPRIFAQLVKMKYKGCVIWNTRSRPTIRCPA